MPTANREMVLIQALEPRFRIISVMVDRVTIEPVSIPLRQPVKSQFPGYRRTQQKFTEPVTWNSKQQSSPIVHDPNNLGERSVQVFDVLKYAIRDDGLKVT